MPLPSSPSASIRRLNPHLFGGVPTASTPMAVKAICGKRVKQKSSDGLNLTERAFYQHLQSDQPVAEIVHDPHDIRPHGLTLLLANGCKYTPDFFYSDPKDLRAYEVKGKHAFDDAIVKLKVAASQNPWLTFYLVSGDSKGSPWKIQKIIP